VDLVQGVQPGNPPAGSTRLWSDGQGHLQLLQGNGANYTVLDSNNYVNLITLAGDVLGPLNNTTVRYRNNSAAYVFDSGGTQRNHVTFGNETLWWAGPGGGFRWVNQANTVEWLRLDTNGGLTTAGNVQVNGGTVGLTQGAYVQSANNWLYLNSTNGVVNNAPTYLFSGNAGIYWQWDGTYIHASHSLVTNGQAVYLINNNGFGMWTDNSYTHIGPNMMSQGAIYFNANPGIYINWPGNGWHNTSHGLTLAGASNSASCYLSVPARVGPQICLYDAGGGAFFGFGINNSELTLIIPGNPASVGFRQGTNGGLLVSSLDVVNGWWNANRYNILGNPCGVALGRISNEVQTYTHTYNGGSHYVVLDSSATSYTTRSASKYKTNINEMEDGDCLKRIIDPTVCIYSYEHVIPQEFESAHNDRPPDSSKPNISRIGFLAEEMDKVVPESVAYHTEDGTPDGIAYAELVSLVWGAIRALNTRMDNAGIAA